MLYTTLHNRILRLVLAVLGELIAAAALNLFIVPLSLYTGGLLGFCQLVRTLLQDFLGVSFGAYDIAGVLYFLLNIPLLMIGYRNLGRGLAVRTIICTVSYSVFYSIIPIPTQPIVDDYLTACALSLSDTDTYELLSAEENEEYSKNLSYPVYIVTYTAGENEDTREWTVFAMDTDVCTYLYGFCALPDAAADMSEIYQNIFSQLSLSDEE